MLAILTVTTDDAVTAIATSRGPASLRRELVGFRAPDVVVLDVEDANAPELVAVLSDALPDARLLVVGPAEDAAVGLACLRAGADGVISRAEASDGLATALRGLEGRRAARGTGATATALAPVRRDRGPVSASDVPLTAVQARILDLMTTGATNRAIAERLGRSEKAVKNEATAIYAVLGAANRTEAVALWSRLRGVPA